ncbi:MAG: DUF6119 family protein [Pseudobdellovibrionaceae bacterium]
MTKTNKINFYLIKDEVTLDRIFKEDPTELDKITVKDGFDLYYNKKAIITAPWVKDFFNTEIVDANGRPVFNAASSQAVLLRKITIRQKEVTFAICFGTGFHMLKRDSYEPRFGLLTVLNVLGENSLRKIDKHDISGTPKFTAEQLSKKGSQVDFGLDFELDILLGVTGALDKDLKRERLLQSIFGTTITGKSNLNVSTKFDIDNIDRLLKISYAASNAKRYEKKGFGWIDKIELVKKKTNKHTELLTKLDEKLLDNSQAAKIWLAVPELVEWQDIKGFYFGKNQQKVFGDISFSALRQVITDDLNVQKLHSIKVNALHSSGSKNAHEWTAYECLYAEIELGTDSYILINSEWYKLRGDFVADTNSKYQDIITNFSSQIPFKNYEGIDLNENVYNTNMSALIANAVCMDAKNISHGGGYSKIEFCDIFDRDNKNIIHIKKYSGSSVLSHLFAQGFVSAQLLLNDGGFKLKVENKINEISGSNYSFGNIEDYKIVFGIIAKPNSTDIPLFSKVNLNNIFMRIRNMKGYTPSIAFIPNQAPLAIVAEENVA